MLRRAAMLGAMLLTGLAVDNHAAEAVTKTGSLALKVVVVASPCTVSGAVLDFGTYTSGQPANLDASTVINFTD